MSSEYTQAGIIDDVTGLIGDVSSNVNDATGLVGNASTALAAIQASAVSITTDIHEMRVSVDKWLKVIAGAVMGFGVIWAISKIAERKGKK
jgi:hypothetical protein